jgi:hypothetical protein
MMNDWHSGNDSVVETGSGPYPEIFIPQIYGETHWATHPLFDQRAIARR